MGYLVNPISGTIETLQASLKSGNLLTMGSNPIQLPFTTGVLGQWLYVPINAFLIGTTGSINYDFAVGDHPVIWGGGTLSMLQWQNPIQNYFSTTDISFATVTQHVQSNLTYAQQKFYKISLPWFFSTTTSNDATVGDQEFKLYIQAVKITL